MIVTKKANLDKIKLKTLINFQVKFQYIFYSALAIVFHLYKKYEEHNMGRNTMYGNCCILFSIIFGKLY